MSSKLWKTEWISQDGESFKREMMGEVVRILNDPSYLGASLALGCMVLMLVPLSHTSCPGAKV